MQPNPSVSVIIPTFNRDHSLLDCLASAMRQDYAGKVEIIVVDQNQQHSRRVLDFFSRHRQKLARVVQEEANPSKARNAGAAAAANEFLVFADDDTLLPPDYLARLAGHLSVRKNAAVAAVPISERDPEASFREYVRLYGNRIRNPREGLIRHFAYLPAPSFGIPADLYRRMGGYDENLGRLTPPAYGEDDEFWLRAARCGVRLFIDPGLRIVHRDHMPGGCGSRQTSAALAAKYHMESMAYIRIRHHGRMGVRGWLQLARGYIVNRQQLRNGPERIVRNGITAVAAVKKVKHFMAQAETRAGVSWAAAGQEGSRA